MFTHALFFRLVFSVHIALGGFTMLKYFYEDGDCKTFLGAYKHVSNASFTVHSPGVGSTPGNCLRQREGSGSTRIVYTHEQLMEYEMLVSTKDAVINEQLVIASVSKDKECRFGVKENHAEMIVLVPGRCLRAKEIFSMPEHIRIQCRDKGVTVHQFDWPDCYGVPKAVKVFEGCENGKEFGLDDKWHIQCECISTTKYGQSLVKLIG